jgi:hypothetical protein
MMRGRTATLGLILIGAVLALMGPVFVHATADNVKRLLIVTALGAVILGLGLGRLPPARE